MPEVLISGASIAGPALAWWLARHGFTPTLLERAPQPRQGGHAVDVRGAALEVLRRMDLLAATEARRTQMNGVSAVNDRGEELWRSEKMSLTGGVFEHGDLEILRDDLAEILRAGLGDQVEQRFGVRPFVTANQALADLAREVGVSEGAAVFTALETAKNAITLPD